MCADMAIQNAIGDSFRGATWVALHNGGGVGWWVVIMNIFFEGVLLPSVPLVQDLLWWQTCVGWKVSHAYPFNAISGLVLATSAWCAHCNQKASEGSIDGQEDPEMRAETRLTDVARPRITKHRRPVDPFGDQENICCRLRMDSDNFVRGLKQGVWMT